MEIKSTATKNADYYKCNGCGINSLDNTLDLGFESLVPCSSGSCEAYKAGVVQTTIQVLEYTKEELDTIKRMK